ncbi:phosphoribosylanthranilate isomerase [Haloferula sp. A504]|uniref:phosphoribosylanthranilate isomerase n=1 Tax=Haloferula sp. A504 TaxID=3373601 RepID=UPI0031C82E1D|nr:phosphoribosylanthranilate isomerase [Verrucomicrobiaceae bacterium E54]
MPTPLPFLDPSTPSLKICGVTTPGDAHRLAELGVHALGANFWPRSKRYLDPALGGFLRDLAGSILRVGVFVNAGTGLPVSLFKEGLIDVVQLHGDEPESDIPLIQRHGIPVIRALAVDENGSLPNVQEFGAEGVLLDAHAPGVYGGTGETIDWDAAGDFVKEHPKLPVILAGGITPENAEEALQTVRPAAIDIASGAESAPGIKDFAKVEQLMAAVRQA